MADNMTMEELGRNCEQRLADAIASGEVIPKILPAMAPELKPVEFASLQTPEGLDIVKYGGSLTVTYSASELGANVGRGIVSIAFSPDLALPPVVTKTTDGKSRGGISHTIIAPAKHERFALRLASYISKVPA